MMMMVMMMKFDNKILLNEHLTKQIFIKKMNIHASVGDMFEWTITSPPTVRPPRIVELTYSTFILCLYNAMIQDLRTHIDLTIIYLNTHEVNDEKPWSWP